MARNKKHIKGDLAELIAAEFFIDKGFYVFRNMSQQGPADMAVLDPEGNIMLVDVKALSLRNKNGYKVNRTPSDEQARLNVQLCYVNLETRELTDHVPRKGNYRRGNVIDIKTYMKVHAPE